MIVCMSNSFLSDIGALIGFILVCLHFEKKKRKGEGEKKRKKRPQLAHNLITSKAEWVIYIPPLSFLRSQRRNAAGQIVPNANGF